MNLPDFFLLVLILVVARALIFFSSGLFPSFGVKPIARGAFWEKRTWREFLLFPVFTGLLGFFFFWPIAGCFGVAWEVGLLLNSFIKRQLGVPAGWHARGITSLIQYLTDIGVPVFAVAGFLCVFYSLSFSAIIPFVAIFFLVIFVIDMVRYTHFQKLDFPNPLVIFFQILVTIAFRLLFYSYGTFRMNHPRFEKEGNIFICNHISKLDAFLISTGIDWHSTYRFLPFRFMVANHYMEQKIIGFLLILVWGYYSHSYDQNGKNQSLAISAEFMKRWETVVIFPEWGIAHKQLRVGAFYLNKLFPGSLLQLFHLKKNGRKFQVTYLGTDAVSRYPETSDLLKVGEEIFSPIENADKK